jgi:peptidoglycan/xylan/chitin deacetylase (PgdA/CDA1 family)
MAKGKLTISIDLALAWSVWDTLTAEDLRLAETAERPICAALIELFDRYEVPATWAIVGALLDEASAKSRPGGASCWYAPDIIDRLLHAKTAHEIGSHGGRHVEFGKVPASDARQDLEFVRAVHHVHALPLTSFVFPRNSVGHLDLLAEAGMRTFRGLDMGWFSSAARISRLAGRAANFVDKVLPIVPSSVAPAKRGGLIEIPGSMLLLGRNGPRRFILPALTRAKLRLGLACARDTGGVFHLWFHPSNFYYRRDEQLATLAWFLEHAADEASRGHIELRTMGSYAGDSAGEAHCCQFTSPCIRAAAPSDPKRPPRKWQVIFIRRGVFLGSSRRQIAKQPRQPRQSGSGS